MSSHLVYFEDESVTYPSNPKAGKVEAEMINTVKLDAVERHQMVVVQEKFLIFNNG